MVYKDQVPIDTLRNYLTEDKRVENKHVKDQLRIAAVNEKYCFPCCLEEPYYEELIQGMP